MTKGFKLSIYKLCLLLNPALFLLACSSIKQAANKPYHHTENGFRNLSGGLQRPKDASILDGLSFAVHKVFQIYCAIKVPKNHVMPYDEALEQLKSFSQDQDIVTWIGHMTTLIRLDGVNILTDPFFSNYAAPLPPFGPRRTVAPGIKMRDLPPIDIILITHDHYDHLDLPSLRRIANKNNITVVTPLKLGQYVRDQGFDNIIELDWYQDTTVGDIRFTALPVIHYSRRGLFDKNKTLWAGYAITSKKQNIFFSGDLEYGTHYKELAKYGPFDLAILSISPYKPAAIMQGNHCKPIDCLKLALEMDAKNFMPVHWGTIDLGQQAFDEPIIDFKKGAKTLNIAKENLKISRIGQTQLIGN